MTVKFLKPAPGYAYSEGMCGDLPEGDATLLIERGYAIVAKDDFSDLPEDFPVRDLLIKEGFGKMDDLRENLDAVREIKGIGKKTYENIVERINS